MTQAKPTLFRPEALEARQSRLAGEVVLAQPVTLKLLVVLLAAAAVTALTYLERAEYARTERVSGYLHPDRGVSVIQPPRAGTVLEVKVAVGQAVHAGEVLLQVRSAQSLADGSGLETGLREGLSRQLEELRSKGETEDELFADRQRQLDQEVRALQAKSLQLEALRSVTDERLAIAAARAGASESLLARGMASEREFQEQHDAVLGLRKELLQLAAAGLEHAERQRELKAEQESAPGQHRQRLADLTLQRLDTEARLRELEGRTSYAVLSPIDGTVGSLQADVGAQLRPEVPVAIVVPAGAVFQAVLLVPTRAAGLIEVGQSVGIKYEAFPYQEFGIHGAHIERIDTAILAPDQVRAPVPVQEPVYRVLAGLEQQHVRALGRPYPLQTGMRFEADIVLERRSLIAWILEPVYGLRGTPRAASGT